MDLKEYIRKAYDYMYWATGRYFAVAESLTNEQLHQVQGHGWGDVHGTLVHMMSSEWVWLQRWHGMMPRGHVDKTEYPTLGALKQRWSEVEAEMRGFIEAHDEAGLQAEILYSNFRGETFRVPLWQMLAHIVNHETHHRGELAGMYALMDVEHPEEEMIQYFLNASGQKKF